MILSFRRYRTIIRKILLIIVAALGQHCAPPAEPTALQSSGTPKKTSKEPSGTSQNQTGTVSGPSGALVGDAKTQADVKACLATGKFYDRNSSPTALCTQYAISKTQCTIDGIKSIMSESIKVQFDTLLSTTLTGYQVDQCMDCSNPTGNAFCEGNSTTKQTNPGIRVFLVKELPTYIDVKTIYLPVKAAQ